MRMLGIEPRAQAWGACMLPLHYMRARNLKRAGFVPRAPAWTRSLWQTEGWIRKKRRSPSDDTLAEWLRRRPAKPMGSPCVGSNPTGVAFAAYNIRRQTKQGHRRWRDPCDAVDKGGGAADTKTDPPQTRHGRSRAPQVAAQLPFGSNYWIVLAFATT